MSVIKIRVACSDAEFYLSYLVRIFLLMEKFLFFLYVCLYLLLF
jgi:hypothetical protein